MQNDELVLLRLYSSIKEVINVELILDRHGIAYSRGDIIPDSDVLGLNRPDDYPIEIFVKATDIEKACKVLGYPLDDYVLPAGGVDSPYLDEFTNEELYDLIKRSYEWTDTDLRRAREILVQRGESIDDAKVAALQKQQMQELAKPDTYPTGWIVAGYLSALLGGIFGVLIGWFLWKDIKILPDGNSVPRYNDRQRWHGKIIFQSGIIVIVGIVVAWVVG